MERCSVIGRRRSLAALVILLAVALVGAGVAKAAMPLAAAGGHLSAASFDPGVAALAEIARHCGDVPEKPNEGHGDCLACGLAGTAALPPLVVLPAHGFEQTTVSGRSDWVPELRSFPVRPDTRAPPWLV